MCSLTLGNVRSRSRTSDAFLSSVFPCKVCCTHSLRCSRRQTKTHSLFDSDICRIGKNAHSRAIFITQWKTLASSKRLAGRATLHWSCKSTQVTLEEEQQKSSVCTLQFKNVGLQVGKAPIIRDINFELFEGEILCLLGPSGSGKSTVLRIAAGLTRPTQGSVYYRGKELHGINEGAAIVFQNFALFPWLTVSENVELGIRSAKSKTQRKAKAEKAIDMIGLDGYENAYPKELSGGMRQRVGFARAIAVEPELLCMDEPFSALDVLTGENLKSELIRLWQVLYLIAAFEMELRNNLGWRNPHQKHLDCNT
jgi:ABC-type nitrate/sulfonate/bicarbonate transport system ATPase subunit